MELDSRQLDVRIADHRLHDQDESRTSPRETFPLIDIFEAGQPYITAGSEPFTPNNELRYKTFQLQDNFTRYGESTPDFRRKPRALRVGNVFFPGSQEVYVYNSLADFFRRRHGFSATRTTSPITLRRFQWRYMNIPASRSRSSPSRCFTAAGSCRTSGGRAGT